MKRPKLWIAIGWLAMFIVGFWVWGVIGAGISLVATGYLIKKQKKQE